VASEDAAANDETLDIDEATKTNKAMLAINEMLAVNVSDKYQCLNNEAIADASVDETFRNADATTFVVKDVMSVTSRHSSKPVPSVSIANIGIVTTKRRRDTNNEPTKNAETGV
jgi:hypothetical protein